jgi:hypothetical protein
MILDFIDWQQPNRELSVRERRSLKNCIMHVLQEHFTGVRLPEMSHYAPDIYITLSRRSQDIRQSAQVVLAKYRTDDFVLEFEDEPTNVGPTRRTLVLREKTSDEKLRLELRLDLPFLDYVMMRHHGEVGQILQVSYINRLARFKSQLLNAQRGMETDSLLLVRLQTDYTFKTRRIAVKADGLEVIDE